jgi:hypothetical protein
MAATWILRPGMLYLLTSDYLYKANFNCWKVRAEDLFPTKQSSDNELRCPQTQKSHINLKAKELQDKTKCYVSSRYKNPVIFIRTLKTELTREFHLLEQVTTNQWATGIQRTKRKLEWMNCYTGIWPTDRPWCQGVPREGVHSLDSVIELPKD